MQLMQRNARVIQIWNFISSPTYRVSRDGTDDITVSHAQCFTVRHKQWAMSIRIKKFLNYKINLINVTLSVHDSNKLSFVIHISI